MWIYTLHAHLTLTFFFFFFFFNDTATTEIYTLSLHDALPIYLPHRVPVARGPAQLRRPLDHHRCQLRPPLAGGVTEVEADRKSTRLNSSHPSISYAVFCLKKKKKKKTTNTKSQLTPYELLPRQ